jgi:UDP-N-acetyl-D-glucosamine dehydrogenase
MADKGRKAELAAKIENRQAKVVVVGLGYVGLPLAVAIAGAGHKVVGIDLNPAKVSLVNQGRCDIEDVDVSVLESLVTSGRLSASSDYQAAADADIAVVAVPTPIDEHRVPDLTAVRGAAEALAASVPAGCLVILESTTYPGTTEEEFLPPFRNRGLVPGKDMFVGYSPERIDPGNATWNVRNTPKVVSGLTRDCLDLTISFYGGFIDKLVPVSSLRTAEITKLFENIFRIVNIALVNEFQTICDGFGIDVWEVIDACATKPFGYMPFKPGPGLGGHCVPVDPFYLAWKAREMNINTEFIELAGRINAGMPKYVLSRIDRLLNQKHQSLNGAHVAVLGVAYKQNTSDVRESPSIPLTDLLIAAGALVTYHDPHVPVLSVRGKELKSEPLTPRYLATQDCVVIVADHDAIDWTLVLQYSPTVLDTRNVLGRLRPEPARPVVSEPQTTRRRRTPSTN